MIRYCFCHDADAIFRFSLLLRDMAMLLITRATPLRYCLRYAIRALRHYMLRHLRHAFAFCRRRCCHATAIYY